MKRKIIIGLTIIFLSLNIYSQHNFVLHNFTAVPQNYMTNPAMLKTSKVVVGIPAMSSFQANFYSNTYMPADLFNDDVSEVDIDGMLSKAQDKNYFSANLQEEFLFIGFKIKKAFLSFGISHESEFRMGIPINLLRLAWFGNGDPQLLNNEINIDQSDIFLNSYNQYHIGLSVNVTPNLAIGTRLKYLHGLANIDVERLEASFLTREDPTTIYAIESSTNMMINTSVLNFLSFDDVDIYDDDESNDFDVLEYVKSNENKGFAFDFGFQYNLNDKFLLSGSIIDMGSIKWKSDIKNYESTDASFSFNGIDLNGVNDTTDIFDLFLDDIENEFEITETENEYKTSLSTEFFLSGAYIIDNRSQVDALVWGKSYAGIFEPAFSLGYYRQISKAFGLKATYSIVGNNYANIGVGMSLNLGPLQAYMITDNVLSAMNYWNSKIFNLRIGLNINVNDLFVYDKIEIETVEEF